MAGIGCPSPGGLCSGHVRCWGQEARPRALTHETGLSRGSGAPALGLGHQTERCCADLGYSRARAASGISLLATQQQGCLKGRRAPAAPWHHRAQVGHLHGPAINTRSSRTPSSPQAGVLPYPQPSGPLLMCSCLQRSANSV